MEELLPSENRIEFEVSFQTEEKLIAIFKSSFLPSFFIFLRAPSMFDILSVIVQPGIDFYMHDIV